MSVVETLCANAHYRASMLNEKSNISRFEAVVKFDWNYRKNGHVTHPLLCLFQFLLQDSSPLEVLANFTQVTQTLEFLQCLRVNSQLLLKLRKGIPNDWFKKWTKPFMRIKKMEFRLLEKNLFFINISDYELHQETSMLKTPKSETSQSIKVML